MLLPFKAFFKAHLQICQQEKKKKAFYKTNKNQKLWQKKERIWLIFHSASANNVLFMQLYLFFFILFLPRKKIFFFYITYTMNPICKSFLSNDFETEWINWINWINWISCRLGLRSAIRCLSRQTSASSFWIAILKNFSG